MLESGKRRAICWREAKAGWLQPASSVQLYSPCKDEGEGGDEV
jgi:hypothetical protein